MCEDFNEVISVAVVDYAVKLDGVNDSQYECDNLSIYNGFKEKMDKAEAQARDGAKRLSLEEVLANFDAKVKTHERV
jgi:hypothetical protein